MGITTHASSLLLSRGLNVIGAPTATGTIHLTAFQLMEDLGGGAVVSSLLRFDRPSGRFQAASYEQGVPVGVDFSLDPREGYILYLQEDLAGFGPQDPVQNNLILPA